MSFIRRVSGDLFKHSAKASKPVFAHATNLRGIWGGGVAAEFQKLFPLAFLKHEEHCKNVAPIKLIGTSQVIETEPQDPGNEGRDLPAVVVCLFLSDLGNQYTKFNIQGYTDSALTDLKDKIKDIKDVESEDGKIVLLMPKINAGIFNVPWHETEKILEKHPEFIFNVYLLEDGWPKDAGQKDSPLDELHIG